MLPARVHAVTDICEFTSRLNVESKHNNWHHDFEVQWKYADRALEHPSKNDVAVVDQADAVGARRRRDFGEFLPSLVSQQSLT